jgi:hypothetical protein
VGFEEAFQVEGSGLAIEIEVEYLDVSFVVLVDAFAAWGVKEVVEGV